MLQRIMKEKAGFWGLIAVAIALLLSSPAFAGVVYSWTTDEGTLSFTDEKDKVPAHYQAGVKTQSLKALRSYPRLTIENRTAAIAPSAPAQEQGEVRLVQPERNPGLSVLVGGTRFGANATVVPVGRSEEGEAPTIIETRRVKARNSMATRHETVISQGGRILSIQRDELSQIDSTGLVPPVLSGR